jgi:predicted nucleic acid-binding Zn ribbon protein
MTRIGDFQNNVGKLSAEFNVISSYIAAAVLFLVAIGIIIFAVSKNKTIDDKSVCGGEKDEKCSESSECVMGKCRTKKATTHLWFLLLAFIIVFAACATVWYSKWWRKQTRTNRTAAQIGAFRAEINMLT